MSTSTEKSSQENPENISKEQSVSAYSLDFTQDNNNNAETEIVRKDSKPADKSSISKRMLKWQNALAIAAILTIAALHFVFQSSFIQSENSQNLLVDEFPVKVEQVNQPSVEIKSADFEVKKINDVMSPKIKPNVRQRRSEAVTSKPQPKKKDAVETPAQRLRRAERILTGV